MLFGLFGDTQVLGQAAVPVLIFFARMLDVSIGTLRIILVSRGRKILAPILGFIEMVIWLLAITQIMQHLGNIYTYLAFAGGFAAGNFFGILLEEKLAMGIYVVRVVLAGGECPLGERLAEEGFGFTTVDGMGSHGPVKMIYTVIRRRDINRVVGLIKNCNTNAFYSIEDARSSYLGIFPTSKNKAGGVHLFRNMDIRKKAARAFRKGK